MPCLCVKLVSVNMVANFQETNWDDLPEFLSAVAQKDGHTLGKEIVKIDILKRLMGGNDAYAINRSFVANGKLCVLRLSFEIVNNIEELENEQEQSE